MQNRIEMFEVDQSLELLNRTLTDKGISPSDVISIQEQPALHMNMGPGTRAKYRVYYSS